MIFVALNNVYANVGESVLLASLTVPGAANETFAVSPDEGMSYRHRTGSFPWNGPYDDFRVVPGGDLLEIYGRGGDYFNKPVIRKISGDFSGATTVTLIKPEGVDVAPDVVPTPPILNADPGAFNLMLEFEIQGTAVGELLPVGCETDADGIYNVEWQKFDESTSQWGYAYRTGGFVQAGDLIRVYGRASATLGETVRRRVSIGDRYYFVYITTRGAPVSLSSARMYVVSGLENQGLPLAGDLYKDANGKLTAKKDPSAVLDFSFDWSEWLGSGDSISNVVFQTAGGIAVGDEIVNGDVVGCVVSGGTAYVTASLTCRVTTVNGLADDRTINFLIRDL